jgi:hypothetical protein
MPVAAFVTGATTGPARSGEPLAAGSGACEVEDVRERHRAVRGRPRLGLATTAAPEGHLAVADGHVDLDEHRLRTPGTVHQEPPSCFTQGEESEKVRKNLSPV